MKAVKFFAPVAVAALMVCGTARAYVSLLDSSMYPALTNTTGSVINGVTFAALALGGGVGTFNTSFNGGFGGLGVKGGPTNTELDVGETISLAWNNFAAIKNFSVALLYNGPEFNDVAEITEVTGFLSGGGTVSGLLTVDPTLNNVATWSFVGGGGVANLSPATETAGGAWSVNNPFGNAAINRLEFTAINGSCGTGGGNCGNQSDYVVSSVTAVPEPGTYALLLAGLGAVGFVAKRRRVLS